LTCDTLGSSRQIRAIVRRSSARSSRPLQVRQPPPIRIERCLAGTGAAQRWNVAIRINDAVAHDELPIAADGALLAVLDRRR
jgi:hypothetical protein